MSVTTATPNAPAHAAPATPPVTAKLIMPFVTSVRAVFSTMVPVPTTLGKPYLKRDAGPSYDVSSIIAFSGDVVGCVVVSLQVKTAEALVKAFAGADMPVGTPDFTDAVGELANMIAGSAKKDLGRAATISIPTVIIGPGHHVSRLTDVPCIVIPCTTPAGEFAVEVSIKSV